MRQFCVIVTREGRLRFKFLKLEHGLLHDKTEKKTYAVIRDAYPTNWAGRWSRAYVVHETEAQTVRLGDAEEEQKVEGGTVQVIEPLNMVAKIRMPGPRGDNGEVRDVHLTAESIYDRTLSVQVRRLGNRRFQWFHALMFVALGVTIGVVVALALALAGSNGGDAADAAPTAPLIVNPTSPPATGPPQSGPAETPDISVYPPPRPAESQDG